MPTFEANGVTLNYERSGKGPPLLLIMGLGGTLNGWRNQVPALSQDFDVIRFDNRGAGGSSAPTDMSAYSMANFAADAVAVLDHLDIAQAHVYGVSMGGMIAQHLVLQHPERVQGLILGCTIPGGEQSISPESWVLELMLAGAGKTAEQVMRDSVKFNFAPDFPAQHPEVVEEYVSEGLKNRIPLHGFQGQWMAITGHDTLARLHTIATPTLIHHGDEDRLVPVGNGKLLAEHIPGAQLELFHGAGHVYFIEQPDKTNQSVRAFLRQL